MFGEPVTYIGYPTSGGGSGTYMQASELYAITAKSSNKDGAWAFIENYLNQPFDDLYSYGLPARKSALDDMVEKALNVTYMTDENGEQILMRTGIRFRRTVLPASVTETGSTPITLLPRKKSIF